jgi:hypothetical protein
MKRITQALVVLIGLCAACEKSFAVLVIEGLTKARAESELGVVMNREFIGSIGSVTNEAGISLEFAPKGKLEGFLFVTLEVYLELPTESDHGSAKYRRLTSVTLKPVIQTEEKVRVFFAVDSEYLDRTIVTIRVRSPGGTSSDGYNIRLDGKDFPPPKARGEPQ